MRKKTGIIGTGVVNNILAAKTKMVKVFATKFQVKWDNVVSAPFCVSNGVCQGGILSPILFNVYMDELSHQLN